VSQLTCKAAKILDGSRLKRMHIYTVTIERNFAEEEKASFNIS
jgi:hypothetical protein